MHISTVNPFLFFLAQTHVTTQSLFLAAIQIQCKAKISGFSLFSMIYSLRSRGLHSGGGASTACARRSRTRVVCCGRSAVTDVHCQSTVGKVVGARRAGLERLYSRVRYSAHAFSLPICVQKFMP